MTKEVTNNRNNLIHAMALVEDITRTNNGIYELLKRCNLEWDANCLKFYNNKRPIKTASDTQARKKIYKGSINSWKNYEKDLKLIFRKLPD